jgi:hypothetical protein
LTNRWATNLIANCNSLHLRPTVENLPFWYRGVPYKQTATLNRQLDPRTAGEDHSRVSVAVYIEHDPSCEIYGCAAVSLLHRRAY